MIISHKHKLIFIKPRKVAGTSFEIALSKFAGINDIITRISPDDEKVRNQNGYCGAQNHKKKAIDILNSFSKKDLKNISRMRWPEWYYNHMSAYEIKKLINHRIWNDYTKVTIVRNPWDYIVSYYFYATRNNKNSSFGSWQDKIDLKKISNHNHYFIDDKCVVDEFIKFENFQEDVSILESKIKSLRGLYSTFEGLNAKAGYRSEKSHDLVKFYEKYPELRDKIAEEFEFEISKFGYEI